jgi:basic membrane lipoprotein Med (substrate-binding protein (PBP1-ABC) superfamily)
MVWLIMMHDRRRRFLLMFEVVALATSAVALSGCSAAGPAAPASRARAYASVKACLLTGAQGVAGSPATQVWAGMQDASLQTHAQVSYLAVSGPATKANALPFLWSLLVEHCNVVIASGSAEQAAALADAAKFPAVRFVMAGLAGDGPVGGSNVSAVSAGPSGGLRGAVAAAVAADLSSGS